MWHKQKSKNPIVRLALLLALTSTPVMINFLKSDYVVAQSATETPSFGLPTAVPQGTTIRVDGSTSMSGANQALKQRFEKEYSGTNVELASNGTDDALKALQEGKIDIAAIGRGLTAEEEQQGLEQQRLRREKIAIVVGKDNPFKGDLTNQQFTRIYRGEITDWSELGAPSGKIRVVDRPDISDTRQAFRNYPLFQGNLFKTGSNAIQLVSDDPAEVVKELGNDGIGFVLANQVSKLDNVRILSMHKTLPDDARYPYSQPLVYVFRRNPSEAVKNFVGFATAAPGQEALQAAREQEAFSVAQTVAQAISGDANTTATITPGAVTTPGNTQATTDNTTNNNSTATGDVGNATNTSTSSSVNNNNQAFVPGENAGVSTEAAEARTIPWWWILFPVGVLGALLLWWLLGRRRSQEDDTVARGVLPDNSPPPFTPQTTSASSAVAEPIATTPVEPSTSGMNTAGLGLGALGIAGLGAAAASRNQQDTSEVESSSELSLDTPDLQQPDIPDTGLDLEAPAAVVNSSYHSLPRISTPIDEEIPPTQPDNTAEVDNVDHNVSAQELPSSSTSNWLGNFALGGAAAAGAARIKSKLTGKDVSESAVDETLPSDNSAVVGDQAAEVEPRTEYSQLPDVWQTPETEQPSGLTEVSVNDETLDNSNLTEENQETLPADLWGNPETEQSTSFPTGVVAGGAAALGGIAAVSSGLWNNQQTSDDDNHNLQVDQETSPADLWEEPQTEQSASFPTDVVEASVNDNNIEESNITEVNQETSPADLWEEPQTEQSTSFPTDVAEASVNDNNIEESNITEVNQETSPADLWEEPQTEQSASFPTDVVAASVNDNTIEESNITEVNQETSPADLWEEPQTEQSASFPTDVAEASVNDNNIEESNITEVNQETSPADLWEEPQTEQSTSFPTDVVAAGAAALGGIAAVSSGLWNNQETSENDNNNVEAQVDQETLPADLWEDSQTEKPQTDQQENLPNITDISDRDQEQLQVTEEAQLSTPDLPEVRIIGFNEQSADAQITPPQEQKRTDADGLPNVWITQPTTPTETVSEEESQQPSEEQITQFGISSNSEDNPASAVAATVLGAGAFALGSQMLDDNEESQEQDENPAISEPSASQLSFSEDVALDRIADEAEVDVDVDTKMSSSEPDLDEADTAWDRIYGIHHQGGTGVPGESNILLASRTPKWAYASWNISADSREAMQHLGATQLVLRLYDVTNVDLSYQDAKLVQQYECETTVSHRYVAIPNTDRDYIAEIGYLTKDKEWSLISRSPIVRVFSRPHKDFWFEADAELIIHGATEPGSTVTIEGQNIKVKQDGTFHLRVPFTESTINYLITAVAPNSEEARTIHMQFSQKEPKNS
ncbi:substrate-binding domain-containing protein [Plectonema cf. radiosum LEGE 06105]|uniref:Substrate-binding domain-containing protein n=1 Tax=Plectonema cf. radiosum LEGE 06105 TaxID=945769 RepID=A0A8J7F806_9CYAN|nr:substrate-binding domain-containing protein [Plectonema radiosum]MBE9213259.1 substrate-binding domain-containing protein [Plectonema cf. radiosum LEGE 06105]